MNKAILASCIVAVSLLLFCILLSGCGGQDELPTNIGSVGDAITKEPDLLPPSDEDMTPADKQPDNSAQVNGENLPGTTVEDVKQWVKDVTSGSYSKTVESGSDITVFNAPLTSGGECDIIAYCDAYQMTQFRFSANAENLLDKANACISAYIGRPMTVPELDEIADALGKISATSDIIYLPVLSNTASAYVLQEDAEIMIQIQ